MDFTLFVVLRSLSTLSCAAGSIWLCANNTEGWGWFLLAAVLLGMFTISTTSTKSSWEGDEE